MRKLRAISLMSLSDEQKVAFSDSSLTKKLEEKYFYSKFFKEYSQLYFQCDEDLSFIVCSEKGIHSITLIAPIDSDTVTYFGDPVVVIYDEEYSREDTLLIDNVIAKEVKKIAVEKELLIDFGSTYSKSLYRPEAKTEMNIEAIIPLSLDEKFIKSGTRKSYRSLINWGERELDISVIDSNNLDEKRFFEFQKFHIKVAEKETRSTESWEKQLEMIKNKRGFLVLAYYKGELVSGILTLHGRKEAYYGVGVNRRDLMESKVAIGHYPLLYSVYEAKRKNIEIYNLGNVGPDFKNDKDLSIAKFKKGFASDLRITHRLRLKC